ncbi:interleukin-3 receptor subunit alpha [Octodon degus]|uniref:Interleukin-3 receptor subunit alpha n=1 Tax=Octodon degus TaxID=10160 RepID=A0A6P6DRD1_OCTDE|nr:interleukin-3 receptor subunit alpha [Octodon degus]
MDDCDRCEHCYMRLTSPCTVTNYTVVVARPPFSAWVLFPPPETFSAPNITTECNQSQARMSWAPPQSHFSDSFEYELLTQQIPGSPSKPTLLSENWFLLPNPGTYSAQIRARPKLNGVWTAWSTPQTFVCDSAESSHARLWRTALPVALGTVLLAGAAVVACRRSGLLTRVFPRLPPMKNPLADAPRDGELMPWTASQEDCPVSEVQLVVEEK